MHITFNFDTSSKQDAVILSKLLDALGEIQAVQAGDAETQEPAAEPEKKRGRKPKAEPAPVPEVVSGQEWKMPEAEPADTPDAPEVEAVAEPELPLEAAPVAAPAKAYTLDDVRGALHSLTVARGVPAGIELLKQFDAQRISELDAGRYAEFIKACAV